MKKSAIPVIALVALAAASLVRAQVEESTPIDIVVAERIVAANVTADNDEFTDCILPPMDCPEIYSPAGNWVDVANTAGGGKHGSSGFAEAQQATNIDIGKGQISGTGKATGEVTLGGGEGAQVDAAADSRLFVNFNVPKGTPYVLVGRLIATTTGASSCLAGVTVSLSLNDNYFVDCNTPPEQECFCFRGTILDENQAFAIEANAFPFGGGGVGQLRRATADFIFTLAFGDLVFADDFELGSTASWANPGCEGVCG
jgi:hypothetical protein